MKNGVLIAVISFLKTVFSTNLRKLKKPAALCITLLFIISIFAASAARADSGSTIIFSSGFEDGFNSWTATHGGVSIVSFAAAYSGIYVMKCSDPWGSQAIESIGTQSETYTEAEFWFDQSFVGSQTLIAYFDGNGNPTVSMGLSVESGNVFAFIQTNLPSNAYSQYQIGGLSSNTWNKFALDASTTSATIYLGDQQLTSVSQNNIPATASVSVGMFWGDGAYTGNLYIDSVQISTSPPPPPLTTTLPGASLFYSGFEYGFNSWTATYGGVSVVSSPVFSGKYALKCSDPWWSQAIESVGTQGETYTSAEFYFDRNIAGSQTLIAYFNGNGDPSVSMGISVQSGRVVVFVLTLLPIYSYRQYELTGVTPSNWYKFALDASSTSAAIYVNNQEVTSISQSNIPATASVSVGMFWGNGAYTGNLYIDSVQISTSPIWSQAYGGPSDEVAYSVVQTSDGGYAMAGSTAVRNAIGIYNDSVYLVKTDSAGTMLWNKTYGGTGHALGYSVIQTSDGGYAVAGTIGFTVPGGPPNIYNDSVYLVKTDSVGNMLWNKTYGETGNDGGSSVIQTSDGGYVIGGTMLIKTDASGNMLWNKTYSGLVISTSDGGYAILGTTLIKTDASGNMLWNKTYSGSSFAQTSDGGYVIAGGSASPRQGVNLVKTDSLGNMLWNETYEEAGTSIEDILGTHWGPGYSVVQTSDGGYAVAGTASGYRGYYNTVYLIKTDSAGNMQWSKLLGRSAEIDYQYGNYGYSVVQSSDGGYAIAGETNAYGAGGFDAFWVKIDVNGNQA